MGCGLLIVFDQALHKSVLIEFSLDRKLTIRQVFLVHSKAKDCYS